MGVVVDIVIRIMGMKGVDIVGDMNSERNGLDRCGRKDMNSMGECRYGINGLDDGG